MLCFGDERRTMLLYSSCVDSPFHCYGVSCGTWALFPFDNDGAACLFVPAGHTLYTWPYATPSFRNEYVLRVKKDVMLCSQLNKQLANPEAGHTRIDLHISSPQQHAIYTTNYGQAGL